MISRKLNFAVYWSVSTKFYFLNFSFCLKHDIKLTQYPVSSSPVYKPMHLVAVAQKSADILRVKVLRYFFFKKLSFSSVK